MAIAIERFASSCFPAHPNTVISARPLRLGIHSKSSELGRAADILLSIVIVMIACCIAIICLTNPPGSYFSAMRSAGIKPGRFPLIDEKPAVKQDELKDSVFHESNSKYAFRPLFSHTVTNKSEAAMETQYPSNLFQARSRQDVALDRRIIGLTFRFFLVIFCS